MKKFLKSLSIQRTIFLGFLVLMLTIIITISTTIYYQTNSVTVNLINNNIVTKFNDANNRLANIIDETFYISQTISSNIKFQDTIKNFKDSDKIAQFEIEKSINNIMTDFWTNNLSVSNIKVLLPNKKYVSSTSTAVSVSSLEDARKEKWFSDICDLSVALVRKDKTTKNSLTFLTIVSQIKDVNNELIGYVCIGLSEDYFHKKFLGENETTDNSNISIVDNKGNIILTNNDDIMKNNTENLEKVLQFSQGGNLQINNNSTLLSYSETNKQGWKIIETAPIKELYTPTQKIKYITIISICLALVLGLILSAFLAKIITNPIITLAGNMKIFLKTGNKVKMVNEFDNEVGVLVSTYNSMLDKIDVLLKEEKEHTEQQKQLELKVLQAQINPHFLYNTLDSISWSAIKSNVPEISEMLNKLGKLYQFNLYKGIDVCQVENEINHITLYMMLQQQCFHSNFIFDIDISSELSNLYMPRFILQPIIENSIIHGFNGMKINGIITVEIYADDNLMIVIEDNGKGMDVDTIKKINNKEYKSQRYGITNIIDRISLICGDEYGLKFSENCTIGTKMIIKLPLAQNADNFKRRI